MIYRAAAVGIIGFWLIMMGLLLRTEWFPGAANRSPIPVDRLFKLMFLHEQTSDLVIFHDHQPVGDLNLQPHRFPAGADGPNSARNLLAGSGSTTAELPGLGRQHISLRGAFALDNANAVRHFELTATFHEPKQNVAGITVVVDGEPPQDRYHYLVRQGTAVLAEQSGPAAALLDQPDLRALGINPTALTALARQQASTRTQLSAQRGVFHAKGDDIETYDVTIQQGDAFEATIQLSQLGQVLSVQTSAGYSLLDPSLAR